jgi:hypothetical protein
MDVVELFIAVTRTEQEGEDGILRCEKKDDWKLRKGKET